MELGLAGKAAIVTGATGGIGGAIACALSAEGVNLGLIMRDLDRGQAAADRIRSLYPGSNVFLAKGDVTVLSEVEAAVADLAARLGRLDILVNSAGGSVRGLIEEVADEDWARYMMVKPLGYVRTCRAAIPFLKESPCGRIINISGGHGKEPTNYSAMGATANAGTLGLTKSLADQMGPFGITVNAVCPGHTNTVRWAKLIDRTARERGTGREETEKFLLQRVPMGKVVEPEDIANLVVFLASERAGMVSGCTINVDGGRSRSI